MFASLRIVGRCLLQPPVLQQVLRSAAVATSAPIVDINMDEMMLDDPEFGDQFHVPGQDGGGVPLAPVDINAWEDEEEAYQGTVDIEKFEKKGPEYPPAPKERTGVYEFKGLKIVMPRSMHDSPGTYRYRLSPEDMALPDDIRICKFEPKD